MVAVRLYFFNHEGVVSFHKSYDIEEDVIITIQLPSIPDIARPSDAKIKLTTGNSGGLRLISPGLYRCVIPNGMVASCEMEGVPLILILPLMMCYSVPSRGNYLEPDLPTRFIEDEEDDDSTTTGEASIGVEEEIQRLQLTPPEYVPASE